MYQLKYLYFLFIQGYTNVDNPFGDEHLLDTFVWSKKLEREGKKDLTPDDIQKMQRSKMIQNKVMNIFSTIQQYALFFTY